jgi:flagellar P-ring protein precursor FlgI
MPLTSTTATTAKMTSLLSISAHCGLFIKRLLTFAVVFALVWGIGTSMAAPTPHLVALKDVVRVKDVRPNQLVGYGLVVGLSGTGDSGKATRTAQWNLLNNMGGRVENVADLQGNNAAQVLVTASIPAFARAGDKLDVIVSSIGKVKSLEGGVLISTQLLALNGETIAVAQGALSTGGVSVSSGSSSTRTAITTTARIPEGALVEREIMTDIGDATGLTLVLNRADFSMANTVAHAINSQLCPAKALDAATVRVQLPPKFLTDRVGFLAYMEQMKIPVTAPIARVVVNERTGTIVIGTGVKLLPAAVAHGGITVSIQGDETVSQPESFSQGQTTPVSNATVTIEKAQGSLIKLGPTNTLNDLVTALNAIGVTPTDLISILQALKAAGSLEAELEII